MFIYKIKTPGFLRGFYHNAFLKRFFTIHFPVTTVMAACTPAQIVPMPSTAKGSRAKKAITCQGFFQQILHPTGQFVEFSIFFSFLKNFFQKLKPTPPETTAEFSTATVCDTGNPIPKVTETFDAGVHLSSGPRRRT